MGNVLDLETGKATDENDGAEAPKRGPGRPKGSTNKTPDPDRTLRGDLKKTLDEAGEWRLGVGDDELGQALKEDAQVITNGLMLIAQRLNPFKTALIVIVAVAGPMMAFGRVGRILLARSPLGRRREYVEEFQPEGFEGGDEPQPQL